MSLNKFNEYKNLNLNKTDKTDKTFIKDNKSIPKAYPSKGGYLKEEAIGVFRKFYIRGNEKAPDHKRQRKII